MKNKLFTTILYKLAAFLAKNDRVLYLCHTKISYKGSWYGSREQSEGLARRLVLEVAKCEDIITSYMGKM